MYENQVKCAKESAGKRYGTSGTKMGNASLTWAFSEAAVLFSRANPTGQKSLARLEKNHRSFLHVLDVLAGIGQQHAPLPYATAQPAHLVRGPEGPRQQTKGMEPLQPLAIVHITLWPPLDVLPLLRIDQQHLKAACLQ